MKKPNKRKRKRILHGWGILQPDGVLIPEFWTSDATAAECLVKGEKIVPVDLRQI